MLGRNKVRKERSESSLVLRGLMVGLVVGYFTRRRGEASRLVRAQALSDLAAAIRTAIQASSDQAIRDLTQSTKDTE